MWRWDDRPVGIAAACDDCGARPGQECHQACLAWVTPPRAHLTDDLAVILLGLALGVAFVVAGLWGGGFL